MTFTAEDRLAIVDGIRQEHSREEIERLLPLAQAGAASLDRAIDSFESMGLGPETELREYREEVREAIGLMEEALGDAA